MVRLLEMAHLKQSGAMEQRLASLEEQVGSRLGPLFLGMVPMALLAKPQVLGGCLGKTGVGSWASRVRAPIDQSCFERAFQVAQTATALHWIVKALRDSGFGSEEGVPTLGEWVAVPAAGLYPPVLFSVWVSLEWRGAAPAPWDA